MYFIKSIIHEDNIVNTMYKFVLENNYQSEIPYYMKISIHINIKFPRTYQYVRKSKVTFANNICVG